MVDYVVRDVVRDVIADVAINELFIVDGLALHSDAAVVHRLRRGGGRNEPLGFGVEELTALATPVVWLALDELAHRIAGDAIDGAFKGLKSLTRRVLRNRRAPTTIPALSREQLVEVRRMIEELAAERGLEPDRAQEISDAVVARLATAPEQEPRTGSPTTTE